MIEEQARPPRRTLGDYVMYQGAKLFSSIAIRVIAKAVEIKPDFFSLSSISINFRNGS